MIIDEVGYLPLPGETAAALFQVVSQRYLKGSVALSTNLGIASWGKVFNDDPMIAGAMLAACCTEASLSTSTATATGCAATGPGPKRRDAPLHGQIVDTRAEEVTA